MTDGGWYGTSKEWERVEGPFIELDPKITEFAENFGLTVTKNSKNWPELSLQWGEETKCLIQISLVDKHVVNWNMWICCSKDITDKRYWKHELLVERKTVAEFRDELIGLLIDGRARLIEWSQHPETLEFATDLASL